MYISTGPPRGIRIVATRHPITLCTLSITRDLLKVAYAAVLIRTRCVLWRLVICVQRRSHIFSYASLRLTSTPQLDVLPTPETLRWRRPSSRTKSCQGTVFSLSTVVKNRCKRCRGPRLKATLCSCFFPRENLNADRYCSLTSHRPLCAPRFVLFVLSLPSVLFNVLRIVTGLKGDLYHLVSPGTVGYNGIRRIGTWLVSVYRRAGIIKRVEMLRSVFIPFFRINFGFVRIKL